MKRPLARVCLAALALLCVGGSAVALSASRAQAELVEIAFRPEAPPPPARIAALERRARQLNPDRRVDLVEGVLLRRAGDHAAAADAFHAVARDEPANVNAWALTAQSARAAGRADLAREAAARVRALNPRAGRRR